MSTSQLLLLELDALKFYPNVCDFFLHKICRKIQKKYSEHYLDTNVLLGAKGLPKIDSTSYGSVLQLYIKRLQKILYLEITNGGVPEAFRTARSVDEKITIHSLYEYIVV